MCVKFLYKIKIKKIKLIKSKIIKKVKRITLRNLQNTNRNVERKW